LHKNYIGYEHFEENMQRKMETHNGNWRIDERTCAWGAALIGFWTIWIKQAKDKENSQLELMN
jgi:hypothetical protein